MSGPPPPPMPSNSSNCSPPALSLSDMILSSSLRPTNLTSSPAPKPMPQADLSIMDQINAFSRNNLKKSAPVEKEPIKETVTNVSPLERLFGDINKGIKLKPLKKREDTIVKDLTFADDKNVSAILDLVNTHMNEDEDGSDDDEPNEWEN